MHINPQINRNVSKVTAALAEGGRTILFLKHPEYMYNSGTLTYRYEAGGCTTQVH